MDKRSGERLAAAISTLIMHFKVGPQGTPYGDLSLTDTAIVSRIAAAMAGGREPIQKEIGEALGLPKTTMTSAVKRLSARGLVEQGREAKDARAKVLRLTAQGQELMTLLGEAQLHASMAMLGGLSARDRTRLIELLETVAAQVQGLGKAPL